MRVIKKNVLVEKDAPEEQTKGALIISLPKDNYTGTVIGVGETVQFVKPGDRVRFHKLSGTPIDVHGKNCIILSEKKKEIIAIL